MFKICRVGAGGQAEAILTRVVFHTGSALQAALMGPSRGGASSWEA